MEEHLQEWIELQSLLGLSANQIYRLIGHHIKTGMFGETKTPHIRTIQRIVKDMKITDTSYRWSIKDYDGEDARLIFDVLAEVIDWSDGQKYNFTKKEAEWVLRISKATGDLHAFLVWILAKFYMYRELKGIKDTEELDMYIAFTPWRSMDALQQYNKFSRMDIGKKHAYFNLTPLTVEKHSTNFDENDKKESQHERTHT